MVDVAASIITPVWNRSELTHQFLYRNWQLYLDRPEIEFVIIDNGSTDNTAMILAQWQKIMKGRLIVRVNEKNLGFGPANNQGSKLTRGDILIFLSNDVTPLADYIESVRAGLRPDELIGAQLFDFDTGWNRFNGKVIAYLGGWCLACLRSTWDRLGGFDERYVPCDYEDVDLSYTAWKLNISLRQVKLPLQHSFGVTANQLADRLATTRHNQALFRQKWDL